MMKDDDWLNPFAAAPQLPLPAPVEMPTQAVEWTPELQAARRADLHARIARVMKPYRKAEAAAPDPEAALLELFAAHEAAVYDAAAAARQKLAGRQAAWRPGRALDG